MGYCKYPPSIDQINEDGFPKSLIKLLRHYYESKRAAKKALDIELVARETGLHEDVIREKFQSFRMEIKKKTSEAKLLKSTGEISQISHQESIQHVQQYHFYSYPNLYPSPPLSENGNLTTPLDQPLTVEITEVNREYYSLVPCLQFFQ